MLQISRQENNAANIINLVFEIHYNIFGKKN